MNRVVCTSSHPPRQLLAEIMLPTGLNAMQTLHWFRKCRRTSKRFVASLAGRQKLLHIKIKKNIFKESSQKHFEKRADTFMVKTRMAERKAWFLHILRSTVSTIKYRWFREQTQNVVKVQSRWFSGHSNQKDLATIFLTGRIIFPLLILFYTTPKINPTKYYVIFFFFKL